MIFFICHRCQRHRWCTLSCEYLYEFSNKFETAQMGCSGAWGKRKNEVENLVALSFKAIKREPCLCLRSSLRIRIHNTAFSDDPLFRKLELEIQKDPHPGVHTGHAGSAGGNIVVANQVRLVRNHG
jgi:hypothetical protein